MKALLFTLCLLSQALWSAPGTFLRQWELGTISSGTGSATYAINNGLTGTVSSAIDLDGYAGAFLQVTSSGQAQQTEVWFSQDNSTYNTAYTIENVGSYFVNKQARYMKLKVGSNGVPGARQSVRYTLAASSGSSNNPIAMSPVAGVKIDGAYTTSFTWTQTPTVYNLSSTAGVAGKGYMAKPRTAGPCAGMFVDFTTSTSSSALNSGWSDYIPLSTTGSVQYGPYAPGFHIIGRSSSASPCVGSFVIETVP